jgi:hypothetical protein
MNKILCKQVAPGIFNVIDQDSKDIAATYKIGKPLCFNPINQSERSVEHHQLYWAGLIELALSYWEPSAGCVSPNEEAVLSGFTKFLSKAGSIDLDALETVKTAYIDRIKSSRAHKHDAPEKTKAQIHRWVKEQTGYYDLQLTPTGWVKKVQSINFNAMNQEEFNVFYKAAFSCIWKFVLSHKFSTEKEAEDVINELSRMG